MAESAIDTTAGDDSCWVWKGRLSSRGYGMVPLGHRRVVGAHRLAWELVNGPIPDGMFVCHHCDNPPCVNPSHLFVGSHSDNMRDRQMKGRDKGTFDDGVDHPLSKLDPDKVQDIRRLLADGKRISEVARAYQVHYATIRDVASGRTWKNVP